MANDTNLIDNYISKFPDEVQEILENVRQTIKKVTPNATETIVYDIPTFVLNGNLVHFGGFKKHIGFYPTPSGITKFSKELSQYETAKGSVKFPFVKPMPYELIEKMTKFRVAEQLEKS